MPTWRFAKAASAGTAHLKSGAPCQDRVACLVSEDRLVAVAADGAGSASLSDEGADAAVASILQFFSSREIESRSLRDFLLSAVQEAKNELHRLAKAKGVDAREYATTLLVIFAIGPEVACAHIGDGIVVVCDGGREWSWVFWPDRGEYANTTRFLTDRDAIAHLRLDVLANPISDFAILTDGLEAVAVKYSSQTVHGPFFESLLAPLRNSETSGEVTTLSDALSELLQSSRIRERVSDDVSIVIASRYNQPTSID